MRRSKRVKISKSGAEEAQLLEYFAATHLHHAGNKPEWYGRPFFLEDFQRKYIWYPVFGTGRRVNRDGRSVFLRRYRTGLICMPRDFGKTELASAMLLSEASMHPVNMGQYGIVAYDDSQARKILQTVKAMIKQDDDLRSQWDTNSGEITHRESSAVIRVFPYSEGAVQSWHFNMLIADELHVWRGNRVWDAIVSGMSQVENSLLLAITTAGEERKGLLWDLLNGSEDVTCAFDDPTTYAWWWCADDSADIDDERVYEKLALPSWITIENMRTSRRKLSRKAFERYVFNRYPTTKTAARAMKPSDIRACLRIKSDFDYSKPFCLAIDGAVSGDAFAIVAHQEDDDGYDQFDARIYTEPPPEKGYYDLNQIGQLVAHVAQKYRVPVGIDPSRLLLWANVLHDDYGVELYEIRQRNDIMCNAASIMMNSVRSHKAALGGLELLAEHMENCTEVERQPYGVRFGSEGHGKGSKRIDGAIAGCMAMWMTQMMPKVTSFEESGGVWSLSV